MPSIKQNPAQQKALNNISKQLTEVETLNSVLSGSHNIFIGIQTGEGRGKGSTGKIALDNDKDLQRVLRVVRDVRSRIVKDIRAQASKYEIELEEDENAILDGGGECLPDEDEADAEPNPSQGDFGPPDDI